MVIRSVNHYRFIALFFRPVNDELAGSVLPTQYIH